jgi:hypothetical protein
LGRLEGFAMNARRVRLVRWPEEFDRNRHSAH